MRVLLIENELSTARTIEAALQAGRCVVDVIDSGEEALEMVRHYEYDAVILDLSLPDMDGHDVLRRMRAAHKDTPVLALCRSTQQQAKLRAFSLGADDLMTRPYDNDELVARVQAIVRRSRGHSKPGLQIGAVYVDLETREITVEGKPVHFTLKEFAVLELLIMRKGAVLTKESILSHLYSGMDEPEPKIIDVFVCKIRTKLAKAGAEGVISTVWGRGYTVREPSGSPARQVAVAEAAQSGSVRSSLAVA